MTTVLITIPLSAQEICFNLYTSFPTFNRSWKIWIHQEITIYILPTSCHTIDYINRKLFSNERRFSIIFQNVVCDIPAKKYNLHPDNLKNFRPLLSLMFLSKIIEKAVVNWFHKYLSAISINVSFQSPYKFVTAQKLPCLKFKMT